jgi:hypothetical protein
VSARFYYSLRWERHGYVRGLRAAARRLRRLAAYFKLRAEQLEQAVRPVTVALSKSSALREEAKALDRRASEIERGGR